jgi:HEAT repeat protein/S1-C subfamily serine protease
VSIPPLVAASSNRSLILLAIGIMLFLFGIMVIGCAGVAAYWLLAGADSPSTPDPLVPQPSPKTPSPEVRPRDDTAKGPSNPPAVARNDGNGQAADSGADKPLAPEVVYKRLLKSTAWIVKENAKGVGIGSGGLIHRGERLVLTNYHVVGTATEVVVFFPAYDREGDVITDLRHYVEQAPKIGIAGKVVASEAERDLALVQLARLPEDLVALPLAAKSASPGQKAFSIGASGVGGRAGGALWRYTTGEVRQVFRDEIRYQNGQRVRCFIVETQAPTNPGDSGGPVVDDRGHLIAVVSGFAAVDRLVSKNIDVREARTTINDYFRRKGKTFVEEPMRSNRTPAQLVNVLRVGPPDEVARAIDELVQLKDQAVPPLREAVNDPDVRVRLAAVGALGRIGEPAGLAIEELIGALSDPDEAVRAATATALGKIGPAVRRAYAGLVKASADPVAAVRTAAAATLKPLGSPVKTDVPMLVAWLRSPGPNRGARVAAVRALLPESAAAIGLFAPLAGDEDAGVRREVAAALGVAGPSGRSVSFPLLLSMLRDSDAGTRAAATIALAQIGDATKNDVPALRAGLSDPSADVRRYSAQTIGALGAEAIYDVPRLGKLLQDPEPRVREAAAMGLARMGRRALPVIDDLIAVRQDREPAVRVAAIKALGTIGRQHPNVVPMLFLSLDEADDTVRSAAAQALNALDPPLGKGDIHQLMAGLRSKMPATRRYAAEALARLGSDAAPAIPGLLLVIRDPDAAVRSTVWATLGELGPAAKGATPDLLAEMGAAMKGAPNAVATVRVAATTLGKVGSTELMLPLLREGLLHKDTTMRLAVLEVISSVGPAGKELAFDIIPLLGPDGTRSAAAVALGKLGKAGVPALIRVVETGSQPAKLAAIETLSKLGPDAKPAVTTLFQAANLYKNTEVGKAAREAIPKINVSK